MTGRSACVRGYGVFAEYDGHTPLVYIETDAGDRIRIHYRFLSYATLVPQGANPRSTDGGLSAIRSTTPQKVGTTLRIASRSFHTV
jgi:hypothetical protein